MYDIHAFGKFLILLEYIDAGMYYDTPDPAFQRAFIPLLM